MTDNTFPHTTYGDATGLAPAVTVKALSTALGISTDVLFKGLSLNTLSPTEGIASNFGGNVRYLVTASAIAWLERRGTIVKLSRLAELSGQPNLVGSMIEACAEREIPVAWFGGEPYAASRLAKVLVNA